MASTRKAVLADIVRGVVIGGVVLAVTLPPIGWALQQRRPAAAVTKAPAQALPRTLAAIPVRAAVFGPTLPQPAVKQVAALRGG